MVEAGARHCASPLKHYDKLIRRYSLRQVTAEGLLGFQSLNSITSKASVYRIGLCL